MAMQIEETFMITDDSLAGVARYLGFHQWPHEYTKAGRSFVLLVVGWLTRHE